MKRRSFLAIAGAAAVFPGVALAQQPVKVPRVAFASGAVPPERQTENSDVPVLAAFFSELRSLGFIEGRNISVDRYLAPTDTAPAVAGKLVDSAPDLIVSQGAPGVVVAAMALTKTIPILHGGGDLLAMGFVSNNAHPGGNVTGVATYTGDLEAKVLAILAEAVPGAKRITYFAVGIGGQPTPSTAFSFNSATAGARKLGLTMDTIFIPPLAVDQDFKNAVMQTASAKADAIQFGLTTQNNNFAAVTARLTLEARMPAISPFRQFADGGGLLSYGANPSEYGRKLAQYAGLVLGGANPGDLPVAEPTVFDFVVNLKTAKAIGVDLPLSILAQATQLID